TGPDQAAPSFLPDAPGTYILQLIVADQGGLQSVPSRVIVGQDPPPTAAAGLDQLVVVNRIVTLNGSGADADGDTLTFRWAFTQRPAGSAAQLFSPGLPTTTFVRDLPGTYVAQLTVSDPLGPGRACEDQMTATTATRFAAIQIQSGSAEVFGLPAGVVTSGGNQNALTHFLANAIRALVSGDVTAALQQLQQALSRVDGCALR